MKTLVKFVILFFISSTLVSCMSYPPSTGYPMGGGACAPQGRMYSHQQQNFMPQMMRHEAFQPQFGQPSWGGNQNQFGNQGGGGGGYNNGGYNGPVFRSANDAFNAGHKPRAYQNYAHLSISSKFRLFRFLEKHKWEK